ncbi:Aste57867_21718 [Aphanomyces stellatus]|uniref:Aste57867_21718 protein n=1 Tax=Aphanomyces stellatus TaxID=120398 RepID=A0A485LKC3_9STRA|nr:hypothetical protein As57867_021649 [Aphanomyces stellatus]VFT98387.1 Aste57867_21718 [Aphanomyces stellatus]
MPSLVRCNVDLKHGATPWLEIQQPLSIYDDHLGRLLNKPLKLLHLYPAGASLASMYYYDTMSAAAQAQYDAAPAVRRRHATKMICGTDG